MASVHMIVCLAAALFAIFEERVPWRIHLPARTGRKHHYEGAESKYKLNASNYIR